MSEDTTTEETAEPTAEATAEATDAARGREDAYVAALLEERRGYAMHDRQDRVAEVDAALKARGVNPPKDAEAPRKRTAAPKASRTA